jgi:hypothetical protein
VRKEHGVVEKPEIVTVLTDGVRFTGAINPSGVETFIMTLMSLVADEKGSVAHVVAFRAGMTRASLQLIVEHATRVLEGGTPASAARN